MRRTSLLVLAGVLALAACSDDASITDPDPLVPPAALLKDIVIPNLPSPYYHLEYDAAYRIRHVSFAADARAYDVVRAGNRIEKLVGTAGSRDTLVYAYDAAGRVGTVNQVDDAGQVVSITSFTYDGARLVKAERKVKVDGDFVVDRTLSFTYDDAGNVMDVVDQRPAIAGHQAQSTTTDHFEQYDTKLNVDGFSLLHPDFGEPLILLPGVELQRGNPASETFTGASLAYTATYTYTYDDRNRPLTRMGEVTWTSGPDAGRNFQTQSSYSYY
ncbi:MAG TPA: hypothetical protein VF034_13115 [Gemmatimonadaceae bacterium]